MWLFVISRMAMWHKLFNHVNLFCNAQEIDLIKSSKMLYQLTDNGWCMFLEASYFVGVCVCKYLCVCVCVCVCYRKWSLATSLLYCQADGHINHELCWPVSGEHRRKLTRAGISWSSNTRWQPQLLHTAGVVFSLFRICSGDPL